VTNIDRNTAQAETLEAVGDETRVGIVQALVDHRRENPRDPGLSFSSLRDHVGVEDSGRFNYHLDKLRDQFVKKAEDEYTLTYAGRKLAAALLTGAYRSANTEGPVEFGDCPHEGCAEALQAVYEEGYVKLVCEGDHLVFQTGLPPAAAAERSMQEIIDLVVRTTYLDAEMTNSGVCPHCYGTIETSLAEGSNDDAPEYVYEGVCRRCGFLQQATPGICIVNHPDVVSFFGEHGLEIREQRPWRIDFVMASDRYTQTSEDPLELRVDVVLDGDELRVTLDETGTVVDTERVK
jgi:DNA-binding transcriptional ArsR family regulator